LGKFPRAGIPPIVLVQEIKDVLRPGHCVLQVGFIPGVVIELYKEEDYPRGTGIKIQEGFLALPLILRTHPINSFIGFNRILP
jgi:hypothetical protein